LWLSGASHPHIWKNKIKKVKKSFFLNQRWSCIVLV
jgi:hypothetical protein